MREPNQNVVSRRGSTPNATPSPDDVEAGATLVWRKLTSDSAILTALGAVAALGVEFLGGWWKALVGLLAVGLLGAAVWVARHADRKRADLEDKVQQAERSSAIAVAAERERFGKEAKALNGRILELESDRAIKDAWEGDFVEEIARMAHSECSLRFGERVSIYLHVPLGFALIGRHCPNQDHGRDGAKLIPNAGFIGNTFRDGECMSHTDAKNPTDDTYRKWHTDRGFRESDPDDGAQEPRSVETLTMKSKRYHGFRIDSRAGVGLGVVMFESLNRDGLVNLALPDMTRMSLGHAMMVAKPTATEEA